MIAMYEQEGSYKRKRYLIYRKVATDWLGIVSFELFSDTTPAIAAPSNIAYICRRAKAAANNCQNWINVIGFGSQMKLESHMLGSSRPSHVLLLS